MNEYTWKNTERVLKEYGEEASKLYLANVKDKPRMVTGGLNNISVIVQKEGDYIQVSLDLAGYWKYIEYDTRGKRSKMPPPEPIRNWITTRKIVPHPDKNGRVPSVNSLAFLIGRKIKEKGTKGTHDLKYTVEELNMRYMGKIEEALALDVTNEWNEMARTWVTTFADR